VKARSVIIICGLSHRRCPLLTTVTANAVAVASEAPPQATEHTTPTATATAAAAAAAASRHYGCLANSNGAHMSFGVAKLA
jgi:hypothetical protein